MKKILAVLLIISILMIAGCTKLKEMLPEPETTQTAIDEVESDIDEIESLEKEFDISELEDLEKELEEINW